MGYIILDVDAIINFANFFAAGFVLGFIWYPLWIKLKNNFFKKKDNDTV